jgi:two-component system sensor kinase FixL
MTFDKFLSGVFEADRERVQRAFNESLSQRTDYYCEFRGQHPKRGLRWFASRARFVCDSQGQPQRLVGISQDITEQKQAEQLLRDSEERLQAVIQNTKSVAIQWYDAQGRVVLWNAASEKMYGYSAEEAMGRTLDQLMLTQEEAATFHKALARVERTEETLYPQEYPFRRRSGETGACLSSLSRIPGRDGGHWFVCMDVDITSQRQAEERVRARDAELTHALRLATMGEMVAQVSHEVNQPLYAIGNYAQASLNELSKPDGGDRKEVQEWLQRIHRASSRSSEVLRQIAGFVRPDDRKRNPTSVNQMIEGALELLSWKTGRQKIDIQFDPLEPDVALRIDAIQFEQVLLNLLSNACEAVVGGGTPAGRVSIAAVQRAGGLQIDIVDNGPGLAVEVRDNPFQAFVTTKPGGLGMGLAISRSLVEAHGGTITIVPNPTQGVTVQLVLPRMWQEDRA